MDEVAEPELTEHERQEAEDRTSVKATVVHETIRYDGEEELNRPAAALAWSALAAGFSMGLSWSRWRYSEPTCPTRPGVRSSPGLATRSVS